MQPRPVRQLPAQLQAGQLQALPAQQPWRRRSSESGFSCYQTTSVTLTLSTGAAGTSDLLVTANCKRADLSGQRWCLTRWCLTRLHLPRCICLARGDQRLIVARAKSRSCLGRALREPGGVEQKHHPEQMKDGSRSTHRLATDLGFARRHAPITLLSEGGCEFAARSVDDGAYRCCPASSTCPVSR